MAAMRKTNRFGRKGYRRRLYKRRVYRPRMYRRMSGLRPEVKKIDSSAGVLNIPATANFNNVNSIGQGVTNLTRIGSKIFNKWISISGYIKHNNTATDGQMIKMWLIMDTQTQTDTLLTAVSVFAEPTVSVISPLSAAFPGRVKILASKVFLVDPSNEIKHIKFFKRLNFPTYFNGPDAGDVQKNALYVCWASSAAVNVPTLNYSYRVAFTDV